MRVGMSKLGGIHPKMFEIVMGPLGYPSAPVSQYLWVFWGHRPFGAGMVPRPNMWAKKTGTKKSLKTIIMGLNRIKH